MKKILFLVLMLSGGGVAYAEIVKVYDASDTDHKYPIEYPVDDKSAMVNPTPQETQGVQPVYGGKAVTDRPFGTDYATRADIEQVRYEIHKLRVDLGLAVESDKGSWENH